MIDLVMAPSCEDPGGVQVQQRYEDLRAQATGTGIGHVRRGHGLSLFLDQGMATWMKAWRSLEGRSSEDRHVPTSPSLSPVSCDSQPSSPGSIELQNELAMILAGLALQIARTSSTMAQARA